MSNRYPLIRNELLELNRKLVVNFKRGVEIPCPSRMTPNPCWLWKGSKSETGYGHIQIKVPGTDGLLKSWRSVPVLSHRVAYALQVGTMEQSRNACHLCRNRNCVNPSHLKADSQAFNVQEAKWWKGIPKDADIGCPFPPAKFWDGFGLDEHQRFYEIYQAEMANEFELQFVEPEIRLNMRGRKAEGSGSPPAASGHGGA
jgi:hypothetical protein